MIHPKVGAAAVGAAITAVIIGILTQSGVHISTDLATSITGLVSAVSGYMMPGAAAEDKPNKDGTIEDGSLDPMFDGLGNDSPGELMGDPGNRPPVDPRDAQIAALTAQITGLTGNPPVQS